jgi:hypothetical protein
MPPSETMPPTPEVQRALATIKTALDDLTPEAPLAVNEPSVAEVDEARAALGVLCRLFGVDIEI